MALNSSTRWPLPVGSAYGRYSNLSQEFAVS
jgi:hypothetical protein